MSSVVAMVFAIQVSGCLNKGYEFVVVVVAYGVT